MGFAQTGTQAETDSNTNGFIMGGVVAEWIGHSVFSAVVAGSNPSGSGWDLQS